MMSSAGPSMAAMAWGVMVENSADSPAWTVISRSPSDRRTRPVMTKNQSWPGWTRCSSVLRDGSIRIFQPPGDKNALGRIRFNFPNRFLVYQHDTPNKNLFARSERALSHGCMRVQNPDEYAQVLLGVTQPEDHYTAARVRSMYGKSERSIVIKQPIPVYVTYQTVYIDDAGKLQTRRDIYGLDKEMVKILGSERAIADKPVARNYYSSAKPVMAGKAKKSRVSSVAPDVFR